MNGFTLNGRMAIRRKAACLLVILFTTAVTVFLLIYPTFIEKTRQELEFAYDSIEVTGWIINIKDYSDPALYGHLWHQLLDTGYIGEHDSYATVRAKVYPPEALSVSAGAGDEALLAAHGALLEEEKEDSRNGRVVTSKARGINRIEAESELFRQQNSIQWLEGYSAQCLTGGEAICLLSAELGWLPGDRVPVYLENPEGGKTSACLTVAGVFSGELSGALDTILPLKTLEGLSAGHWFYCINGFSFTVADSRDVPALKEKLIELELHGVGQLEVRAAIDDRILEGTVAPIKSNLALLRGLHLFFFTMVAVIGFFLCFLLARGRKPEYAVMRMLGESPMQVTLKALLEQFALCLAGIVLGTAILLAAGQGAPDLAACGIILGSYTLGAAAAVLLTVRVNVMEILRDKE